MNPGQQVLKIGKNKAALYDKQTENKVSFKDVAGLQEAKAEVEEVVEFLSNPHKFTKLGGILPKGVLLRSEERRVGKERRPGGAGCEVQENIVTVDNI